MNNVEADADADAIADQLGKTSITAPAVFEPKKAAGSVGYHGVVQTNLAEIELQENIVYFRYDVRVVVERKKKNGDLHEMEITVPTRRDFKDQLRKTAAMWAFNEAVEQDQEYFSGSTAYDRSKQFFSMKELPEKTFEIPASNDGRFTFYCHATKYIIYIKPCVNFKVNSNDLPKSVKDVNNKEDCAVVDIINLFCSQKPLRETEIFCTYGSIHYLMNPANYAHELPRLPEGKYCSVGGCKNVSVLEGEHKKPTAFVSTEVKKTNFHIDDQSLYNKLAAYRESLDVNGMPNVDIMRRNRHQLLRKLKNVDVYPTYDPERVFQIVAFSARTAHDTEVVDKNDLTYSIFEYFRDIKGITLRFPNLFLVMVYNRGGEELFYPVEVLQVAKNQRVRQQNSSVEEQTLTIKASATIPRVRLQQTYGMKNDLGLVPENATLRSAGICISRDLVKAPARQIAAPTIAYGKGHTVSSRDNAKWDQARQEFIKPATVGKWAVLGILEGFDVNFDLRRLAGIIMQQMSYCGMRVQEPSTYQWLPRSILEIENVFKKAKLDGYTFFLFVSSDRTSFHDDVKRFEAKYQILTQDMKASTAHRICRSGAGKTLAGIVGKANTKLGGVNYCIHVDKKMLKDKSWVMDRKTITFAFEISHPPQLSKAEEVRGEKYPSPSILGYAANPGDYFQSYMGDYRYVPPHNPEAMGEEIAKIITAVIQAAKVARQVEATDLVIYFHGIQENQYAEITNLYKKYIRKGLDELHQDYHPLITIIAVSKKHNNRFYKNDMIRGETAVQNVPPGTVLDTVVVNPAINEFYLVPHSSVQGTAKAVKYTLMECEHLTMDQLQVGTHALCFLHEIVPGAVSMPAPLVIADRCVKRATKVFAAYCAAKDPEAPALHFPQLNALLTNEGKELALVRYNA